MQVWIDVIYPLYGCGLCDIDSLQEDILQYMILIRIDKITPRPPVFLTDNHFFLTFFFKLFADSKKALTFAANKRKKQETYDEILKKHLPLQQIKEKSKKRMMNLHTSVNLAVLHIIRVVVVASRA